IQHVQFTLNHFAANVYVGPPTGNDWFEKQTNGTIDISTAALQARDLTNPAPQNLLWEAFNTHG
nr:delta(8)-fatty-acid desaturase-like [Tanacetum cinerariifolium]